MNLKYTKHAAEKLKERGISKDEVETLIKSPEDVLLDIETGNLIFLGKRENQKRLRLLQLLILQKPILLKRRRRKENG